jgi:formylglycine-generating enzyme required for sulfatase activity
MEMEMKFAWIPPGTIRLEGKLHVTITKGFYLGVYPVTQAEWQAVMGYNPSHFNGDDRPVEMVNWDECHAFCQKLGQLTRKPIRLPTEAQWEYACRAGDLHFHSGSGEEALKKVGWYRSNSNLQTHAVGKLAPNAFGLYDLHGNVWEWCEDWHGDYPSGTYNDYNGPKTGIARVRRGGGWNNIEGACRASYRLYSPPSERKNEIGCRVAFCLE